MTQINCINSTHCRLEKHLKKGLRGAKCWNLALVIRTDRYSLQKGLKMSFKTQGS